MFVAALLFAPGMPVRAQTAEETVLVDALMKIVGDSFITYQQISAIQYQLRHEAGMDLKKIAAERQAIMETSVKDQLILNEFSNLEKSRGTNLFPESIIDEIIEERIRRDFGDRTDFLKWLRQQGTTYDDYRKTIRDGFIVTQMRDANVPEPIISPHKVELYYAEHQDLYGTKDRVKMLPIVLSKGSPDTGTARRKAEEILSQIKSRDATFEEMAKVYSEGRQNNADDWREFSTINKPIADELDKLKPGEYGLVETPEACFLVLLKERDPAHVKPLSEVRDEIEKTLKAKEQNRLFDKWINRLKTKTFIQTF